jgi:peptide/nickel transport system substrate-binding protein
MMVDAHQVQRASRQVRFWSRASAALVAVLVLAACGSASIPRGATLTGATSSGATSSGGTVTFAEPPGTTPDFIFPLIDGPHYSVANVEQFQRLMWRVLYLYGKNGQPVVNEAESLAEPPVFSKGNTQVSITLKPYKWSDGTPVTSRDFVFLYNLLKANKDSWAAYLPGEIPDDITAVQTPSSSTFVMTLNQAYSPAWFEANQLSQLMLLPQHAWDKTSDSSPVGDYDTTTAGAKAVYNYLFSQAKDITTYASNPLWQVVDGAWKLSTYRSGGYAAFVPNKNYSGSNKPTIGQFIEQPFTTEEAELNELRTGAVTYGYLPQSDVSQSKALESQGYTLKPWILWGLSFDPINYNNPTVGPIFKQLYFRQALQMLIDQKGYVKDLLKGYGYPTWGPVPIKPENPYVSAYLKSEPYKYDPAKAANLLKSNGWTVNPNGVSVCSGQCGDGVPVGAKAEFNVLYDSGAVVTSEEVQAWKSAASNVGIQLNISAQPFNEVIAQVEPCSGPSCTWELAYSGWLYGVNPYPVADQMTLCGAGSNFGSYCDQTNDSYIHAVQSQGTTSAMTTYENYAAKQLPMLWMPEADYQLSMIKNNLHGVVQSPILSLTPEDWSLSSK